MAAYCTLVTRESVDSTVTSESGSPNLRTVEHVKVSWMKEVELRVHIREEEDDKDQLTERPTRHLVMS